jgi:hypothetical protein
VLNDAWAGKAKAISNQAAEEGLMMLIAGANVVRFAPALIVSEEEVNTGLDRFELACARFSRESHHDGDSSCGAGRSAGLMKLAAETGGGLTSLPADEATLAARIERSQQTWRGELPKSEQGYVFVLEESESGAVVGICAIEVAVGLTIPGTTTASAPGPCLERAERLQRAADAVSQQRPHRQQRAVHAVPRPAVAQRGQRLSAVEIALLVYGRLSRALQ